VFKRLFLEHPRSLGEGYFQHQKQALAFGVSMLCAGCACLVHALVPALCSHTGSDAMVRLQARMSSRTGAATAHQPARQVVSAGVEL
jgi:hypothetical protein